MGIFMSEAQRLEEQRKAEETAAWRRRCDELERQNLNERYPNPLDPRRDPHLGSCTHEAQIITILYAIFDQLGAIERLLKPESTKYSTTPYSGNP